MRRAVLFAIALACHAQEFEVATVKQSPPGQGDLININLGNVQNGTVTLSNATLSECLQFAYGLVSAEQVSGPDWIRARSIRYDIVAKTGSGTSGEQIPTMMQALLADRLKVAVHHEPKVLSYLALTVGKKGAKLGAAAAGGNRTAVSGHISSKEIPLARLATLLSRFERQIIIDETHLTGNYAIELEWTPEHRLAEVPSGLSLYTALQNQLGLRLEPRRGPVDAIVVDRAQKIPVEN